MNKYTLIAKYRALAGEILDNKEKLSAEDIQQYEKGLQRLLESPKPWWHRIRIKQVAIAVLFILAVSTATLFAPTYVYDQHGNLVGYTPLPEGVLIVVPTWTFSPRPTPAPRATPAPATPHPIEFRY